jgi:hypothetical protein
MIRLCCLFVLIAAGMTLAPQGPGVPRTAGPIPPDRIVKLRINDPRPWEATPMRLMNDTGRGTCVASIIDTRAFRQQIVEPAPGDMQARKGRMLAPHRTPAAREDDAPNDLMAVDDVSDTRTQPDALFAGISNTGWDPPDCTVAVGPNHIVSTVNTSIAFFSKTGTKTFQQPLDNSGTPGFFEPQGALNFVFDPKVIYDRISGRFVVVALEYYSSGTAYVDIAVSDDSDPNGTWYKYRTSSVVNIDGSNYWVDYPGLGVDANGIYVTGNLFDFAGTSFGGGWVRSVLKSSVLAGGTASYADRRLASGSSYQVADAWDGDRAVLVHRGSNTSIILTAINNPFTTPSVITRAITVPSNSAPPDAGALGTSALLDTLDGRIMNAVVRGGRLYTCHAVSGATRALARWYQFNLNNWPNIATNMPSLAMSGSISPASSTESTFFPAIAVNARGDVAVVHGASSTAIYPQVRAASRRATDPSGTLGAPVTLATATSSPGGSGTSRWGDYFACAVDPVNDCTFWGIGETRNASGWTTAINSFTVTPSADQDGDGLVNAGDISLMLLQFGDCACCTGDLDQNGVVDSGDVSLLLLQFS